MVDNPLKGYQAITFTFSIPKGEEEGDHLSSSL